MKPSLILLLLLLSACGDTWTETYESDSDCSACYFVDDPIRGEGLVCTDEASQNECSGIVLSGVG